MGRNLTNLHISESFQYLTQISGSELTDGLGVDIDSLNITASTATSASHAVIADSALTATSASLATTASLVSTADGSSESGIHYLPFVDVRASDGQQLFTDTELQYNPATDTIEANLTGTASFADTATSASFATTASYAISSSADDLTLQQVTDNGATTTNDISIDGRIYGVAGISSPSAGGTYTIRGGTVNHTLQLQGNDVTSTNSIKLDNTNGIQISGSLGIQDDITIAGDLTGLASNVNVNSITASFASFTSASIGSLRTVTGSAVIIGDEFIILNADTPTARYAGIKVYDSGSGTPVTASLEWDGLSDNWVLVEESGNSGVLLTGPTGSKGSEVLPTVNTLQKGGGHHTLINSSISDDGTLVTIDANVSASGYVSASTFIGDGSQLSGISTTPFPFTGSAEITGSLDVIGTITTGDGNSTATGLNSAVIGGSGNTVSNTDSAIIGGNNNTATGTYAAVLGGNGQQANALRCVVVGGEGNRTTAGQASVIAGGFNNASTITQGFMGGGSSNNASGNQTGIVAGTSNTVGGTRNTVIGGLSNNVSGEDNGSLAGRSNSIPSGEYNVAVGGRGNTTGTNAFYSVLVGGNNNSIAGFDRSVVLGGASLSSTKNDEVVVPSLSIYGDAIVDNGTTTGNVIDNIGQTAASSEDAVKHIIHLTQAEYDALTPDANTLYVIEGAETLGDTEIDGQLTGAVNTLTDAAGTTALDCSVGNYFTLAMPSGGSTTLTPSNITAGQTINIKITQNATASTLAYAGTIEFPGGTAFTISTGAGEVDVLTLVSFDGTTLQATGLANFS